MIIRSCIATFLPFGGGALGLTYGSTARTVLSIEIGWPPPGLANTEKWVSPSRPLAILIQLEDGKCRASCSWS